SFPDNVALSPQERYLYATYRTTNGVFVFDLPTIRAVVDAAANNPDLARELEVRPIDEVPPWVVAAVSNVNPQFAARVANVPPSTYDEWLKNAIDVRANFGVLTGTDPVTGLPRFDLSRFRFIMDVPEGATNGPLRPG